MIANLIKEKKKPFYVCAGEMAQSIKCLPAKLEDMGLDPHRPHEKLGTSARVCNHSPTGRVEKGNKDR